MTLISSGHSPAPFIPRLTGDGSYTFFSEEFGECFHSDRGARQEAEAKFVGPTRLIQQASASRLRLLDVCYGLGYNSAAALTAIWQVNPEAEVELWGLESDPGVPQAAIAAKFLEAYPERVQQALSALATDFQFQAPGLAARILLGDARQTIQQLAQTGYQADAIFLDPFSPPHCPQLWTVEFLTWVSRCLAPTGRIATYSCAAAVRTALQAAGLHLGSTPPVGRRSPGTVASFSAEALPPLSPQELEHLQTRAAIPYRDPTLKDSAALILERRHREQQTSQLESSSAWKQRWATYD